MFIREETILNATPVLTSIIDAGNWPGTTVRQFLDEFEHFAFNDEELEALAVRF